MQVISDEQIAALGIAPAQCVDWVEQGFKSKPAADMPPKISVHPFADSFYTAMPCYHPDLKRVGVKVISRVPGSVPSLKSKMMLFDAASGDMLALIDTNWITAMRTGAVAALAARTFAKDFPHASFGMVGLGVMGTATLRCLLSICDRPPSVWLMRYKNHAERIMDTLPGAEYHVAETREELVRHTDVLFSCVTVMHDAFLPAAAYPPGYTLIPVHVRGFQDCDLVFDRVFGDDAAQMRDWKNFGKFRAFAEFSDVLLGRVPGRTGNAERIISYNYGIALQDLWFASQIYDRIGA